jgi:hypothetical protein
MSTIIHDIVAKLWNLCNILKDEGRLQAFMRDLVTM